MKWFAETTEWQGFQANHCYLMDDSRSKMFAYVQQGTKTPKVFSEPIGISVKGRRFRAVPDRWKIKVSTEKPQGRTWQVTGSRGDQYTVSELAGRWSCTCSGFQFRGRCKHVEGQQAAK